EVLQGDRLDVVAATKTDDAAPVRFRLSHRSAHRVERMPLTAISTAEVPRNSRRSHIHIMPGNHVTPSFTMRFFIKPPPERLERWSWCSSFWEARPSLATIPV